MRAAVMTLALALAASGARAQPAPEPETPSATETYDTRVRQSFAAAESFRGPLDGGWTLSAKGDGALYEIHFSDNHGKLEGSWRDLRRPGGPDASGFIEQAARDGDRLTLRFSPAADVQGVASLTRARGGAWTGEFAENGRKRAVRLVRSFP